MESKSSVVTCITSEHHWRARVGVSKVPRPRVFCLAEQVQHHANETSEHSNSSRDAKQRRKIRSDDGQIYEKILMRKFRLKVGRASRAACEWILKALESHYSCVQLCPIHQHKHNEHCGNEKLFSGTQSHSGSLGTLVMSHNLMALLVSDLFTRARLHTKPP
jgi:hypothetical protein